MKKIFVYLLCCIASVFVSATCFHYIGMHDAFNRGSMYYGFWVMVCAIAIAAGCAVLIFIVALIDSLMKLLDP